MDDVRAGEAQLVVHGKGGKTRIVPMGDEAAAALRRYLGRGRGVGRSGGRRAVRTASAGRLGAAARRHAQRPGAAHVGRPSHFAKILPTCRHRARVAPHAAARLCHTHAGEGCRSACHPGAARARVRVDHAGVHARQRRAPAARLRPAPPEGVSSGRSTIRRTRREPARGTPRCASSGAATSTAATCRRATG